MMKQLQEGSPAEAKVQEATLSHDRRACRRVSARISLVWRGCFTLPTHEVGLLLSWARLAYSVIVVIAVTLRSVWPVASCFTSSLVCL